MLVDALVVKGVVRDIFRSYGLSWEDAEAIADHLVLANLRGVDSHGVVRVRYYVEGIERGLIKPCGNVSQVRDWGSIVVLDGDGCLGIPAALRASRLAVDRARVHGVSIISVSNLGHVGMLAYYTIHIAGEGLIGFAMANSPAIVAPYGGSQPVFGTNPISIAFPTKSSPVVIDMATSAVAHFRVVLASRRGGEIPWGVAIDSDGRITRDPGRVHALLPFGGYKGYALSLAIEILAGILAGKMLSIDIPRHPSTQGGLLIMAIDPGRFVDRGLYLDMIDRLIGVIKSTPTAEGHGEILIPGEPEEREYRRRSREGLDLDKETLEMLVDIARSRGVDIDKRLLG
jgi:L-2-hydroxycarboxylate dehydrogenase (NAD+)